MGKITISQLIDAIKSGSNNLINNSSLIDSLNVFPVPDGDTGSNMSSTIKYAINNIDKFKTNNIKEILQKFSKEMLLGARGNSGVIFSQIINGFSATITDKKNITASELLQGFSSAKKYAYESVIQPIEGTILTVIREIVEKLKKVINPKTTILSFFKYVVKFGNKSLENTPNLLPILKDAGVVDSGGKGLVIFFEGILSAIQGKFIDISISSNKTVFEFLGNKEALNHEFGFCTEFITILKKTFNNNFPKKEFLNELKKMKSTSEVIFCEKDILKVHCHVPNSMKILNYASKFGDFLKVKIENMTEQVQQNFGNTNKENKDDSPINKLQKISSNISEKIVVISCNVGQGIINDFKEQGAKFIIEGGQTMNPSAGDFSEAINSVTQKNIIILPNNSNVILAARQAAKSSKKNIVVLPTKSQVQGLAALIQFNPEDSVKENIEAMKEAISVTKSIFVTKAIKSTKIDKIKIKEGNYLAMCDSNIILTNPSLIKTATKALLKLIDELSEIIIIYVGNNCSLAEAKEIAVNVEASVDIDITVKYGGQPTYDLLMSIE